MNLKNVILIVSFFTNIPKERVEIIDWDYSGDDLTVKMKDGDGVPTIYKISMRHVGAAKTPSADGDFKPMNGYLLRLA